jgi:hypothetical protein
VNSLKECTGASFTTLYIALDHPLYPQGMDIKNKILSYVDLLEGFDKVVCFSRDVNYGVVNNVFIAIREVFKNHDTIIITEDDNVFSQNFLEFVNKGLFLYKNDSSIFSVNGFNYPIVNGKFNDYDSYYTWTGFSAWGCGMWRDKYEKVEISLEYVELFLNRKANIKSLYFSADHYFPGAVEMLYNKRVAGDTIFSLYQIQHGMRSIFPSVSKVRNYGHDGSGVHNIHTNFDLFTNQKLDNRANFDFNRDNDITSKEIDFILKENFKRNWKSKIYHLVRLVFKQMFYDKRKE